MHYVWIMNYAVYALCMNYALCILYIGPVLPEVSNKEFLFRNNNVFWLYTSYFLKEIKNIFIFQTIFPNLSFYQVQFFL